MLNLYTPDSVSLASLANEPLLCRRMIFLFHKHPVSYIGQHTF